MCRCAVLKHILHPPPSSGWLPSNWEKIVDIVLSTSDPLSNLLYLSDRLYDQATQESLGKETLGDMWTTLAQRFGKYVTEVSEHGSE